MFRLDGGRSFTLSSQATAWFTVAMFAVLAGVELLRGFGKMTNVVLAIVTVVFLMTFLAWAAAGQSFSFVGVLVSDRRLLDADRARGPVGDHLRAVRASSTSPSRA